jgi:hypothetical protein
MARIRGRLVHDSDLFIILDGVGPFDTETDKIPVVYLHQCTGETQEDPTTEVSFQLAVASVRRFGDDEASKCAVIFDGPMLTCKVFQRNTAVAMG